MSPTSTSTNDSIAIRASALKFLSYFSTACSSSSRKDAKNTLIICATREAFIQLLLDEYDAIVGDEPVTGLAYDSKYLRTSDAGSSSHDDKEEDEGDIPYHHETDGVKDEEREIEQEEEEKEKDKERVIKDSEGESSDDLSSDNDNSGSERQLPPEDWPESPPRNITHTSPPPPPPPISKYKPSSQVQNTQRSSSPILQYGDIKVDNLPFGFSAKIEELTAASQVHNLVFCPSLPHLRAYIASIGFNSSSGGGGKGGGGMLGIYNMFSIHSPLELSVQGISRTLSAAVDATINGKLVVCVCEDDEKSTLRLANVGMVGKGLKSFGGDGFEEDEGDQGEIEGRWNVPLEDVLGRWMKIEAVE